MNEIEKKAIVSHLNQPKVRCASLRCTYNNSEPDKHGDGICLGHSISINKHGKCLDNNILTDEEHEIVTGKKRK